MNWSGRFFLTILRFRGCLRDYRTLHTNWKKKKIIKIIIFTAGHLCDTFKVSFFSIWRFVEGILEPHLSSFLNSSSCQSASSLNKIWVKRNFLSFHRRLKNCCSWCYFCCCCCCCCYYSFAFSSLRSTTGSLLTSSWMKHNFFEVNVPKS